MDLAPRGNLFLSTRLGLNRFSLSLSHTHSFPFLRFTHSTLWSTAMAPDSHKLRLFFFPLMTPGHMIPVVDMAKLLAGCGVECTIVTTPANVPLLRPAIDRSNPPIGVLLLPFPSSAVGLPDGCENLRSVPPGSLANFLEAVGMLREPFAGLLRDHLPDAVLTDVFIPWTADVARELGIPRLVFHGTCFFTLCASASVYRHAPADDLPDGAETFVVPGLPHRVEMWTTQLPAERSLPAVADVMKGIRDSEDISYGVVVNSFYELEPDYAQHYRSVVGRKAWHVGPVSLCNRDGVDAANRGGSASADGGEYCLSWLGAQRPRSVLYVCFGSLARFRNAQMREIAAAIEASGHPFIWIARNAGDGEDSEWLPEGFEERMERENRGLLVREWAPQVAVLNHDAVGGFMTHCGWNSCLEGIAAGVPLVTWPLFAEQFYNERLVVDLLKVGVGVGARHYTMREEERVLVGAEAIGAAVARVMGGGEQADGLRRRANALREAARRAVEEGGSSYADMNRLIDDLVELRRRS